MSLYIVQTAGTSEGQLVKPIFGNAHRFFAQSDPHLLRDKHNTVTRDHPLGNYTINDDSCLLLRSVSPSKPSNPKRLLISAFHFKMATMCLLKSSGLYKYHCHFPPFLFTHISNRTVVSISQNQSTSKHF